MSALVHGFEVPTSVPSIETFKLYTVDHAAESFMIVSRFKYFPGIIISHA